uniref:Uncharacterized protein n=1 Tax=Arundo donax TaxID=35708 RepID=A0A0A9HIN6_ARUDO
MDVGNPRRSLPLLCPCPIQASVSTMMTSCTFLTPHVPPSKLESSPHQSSLSTRNSTALPASSAHPWVEKAPQMSSP